MYLNEAGCREAAQDSELCSTQNEMRGKCFRESNRWFFRFRLPIDAKDKCLLICHDTDSAENP